jgi:Na+/proline symporter
VRSESRIYLGVGSFFIVVLLIYFFWSHESTGSVLLLASAGLGLLPGLYIGWWWRRKAPRPQDRGVVERLHGVFLGVVGGGVGGPPTRGPGENKKVNKS